MQVVQLHSCRAGPGLPTTPSDCIFGQSCRPVQHRPAQNHSQPFRHVIPTTGSLGIVPFQHKLSPYLTLIQQFDANFRIRPIILHHFRNRVLIRLLCNFDFDPQLLEEEPELGRSLRQMFGLINIEIDDETDESERSAGGIGKKMAKIS